VLKSPGSQGRATMGREKLVILGGAGSGVIIADAARVSTRAFDVIGFLNDGVPRGSNLSGLPVLGNFAAWQDCPAEVRFISAFPKAKEAFARFARLVSLGIPDARWATVIHPAAHVAPDARLGPGSFVGAAAVVEPGVVGGKHVCVRGGSYVSHDVRLGDYTFIGPNATILGRCTIGEGAHVAANAVCREETSIGKYAVLGLGAVSLGAVPDFAVVAGNPARVVSRLRHP
jgi:acetyltransferase EpsM